MADSTRRFRVDKNSRSYKLARDLIRADRELRQRLIQKRLDQNMSQAQLAEKMGVSQPTVAAFERYDNDPKMSTVRRYAQALEVPISHIVDGEVVGAPQTEATEGGEKNDPIRALTMGLPGFKLHDFELPDLSFIRSVHLRALKGDFVYDATRADDESPEIEISLFAETRDR